MSGNESPVGGQAVIEGVMMRTARGVAIAVRRADGRIVVRSEPYCPITKRIRWLRFPIIRGAVSLFEMLAIGYRALQFSADEATKDAKAAEAQKQGKVASEKEGEEATGMSKLEMAGTMALSLVIAIALFVVVPNLATHYAAILFTGQGDRRLLEEQSPILYNLVSGVIRVAITVGYIAAISLMPDVRRLFQYHGAEHKTVSAYEAGKELTVENVRPFTTLHPRCGTTFIAIVLIVAILVFAVYARILMLVWPEFGTLPFALRKTFLILSHILLMPVIAGVCFELLRLGGKYPNNPLIRILITPGYWFQRLTTKEPDDSMLEVAISALEAAFEPAAEPAERIIEPAQDLQLAAG
ncbi:MAG: membrane protein [Candidatus Sumerlaea sp.]|jgi:uncharacterized protein YqhQ|nr:MAG: membrane protein [Candidatus Sumerlaea sp.]